MTRDEIIRMAREAGLWPAVTDTFPSEVERFAALVAAAEREACVTAVSDALYGRDGCGKAIAAIRARGQA